jgi:hypothetical protein
MQDDQRVQRTRQIWQAINGQVDELEALWPSRSFTIDGHLIGSVGEVLAAEQYGLDLLPCSAPCHDGKHRASGTPVQVKVTQGSAVAFSSGDVPEHVLALKLLPDGTLVEFFNGPGATALSVAGKCGKNGQRRASLLKLKALARTFADALRLPHR